ncbi:hypothetical protein GGU10DRAFT_337376 [Lentinula aff. detonsa]|uniref:Uncharacterized protein n=1 Tax=Lentinula aff. detonsa TaxID=2804958 RepID=A0AA38KWB9_9AGAR|nr:hypothetical protein GGU10DRAFT_337376 [Lentinula aff. detonsa]
MSPNAFSSCNLLHFSWASCLAAERNTWSSASSSLMTGVGEWAGQAGDEVVDMKKQENVEVQLSQGFLYALADVITCDDLKTNTPDQTLTTQHSFDTFGLL